MIQSTKTKQLLLAMCSLLPVVSALSQNSVQHSFSAGSAINNIRDQFLAIHLNNLRAIEINYTLESGNNRVKKILSINGAQGNANSEEATVYFYAANLRYATAYALQKNKTAAFKNYLGYAFEANTGMLKAGNRYSWASSTMLSLYHSSIYNWQKNSVSFTLTIPVVGFVSRPGEGASDKFTVNRMIYDSYSNLSFSSFQNQQAISARLQYNRSINTHWAMFGTMRVDYKRINETSLYISKGYGLCAGITYTGW